jgi:uncharacterized membrane protein YeaQ/YmgE (transglycosylase-associated protein family)
MKVIGLIGGIVGNLLLNTIGLSTKKLKED